MKIDLRKLYGLKRLEVNEIISLDEELYQKMGVKRIDNLNVRGLISVNYENNIELDLECKGLFIMPCSVTFEDVEVPFSIHFEDEILESTLNDDFFLDLSSLLWENIVLEIPFKVVKEGAEIETLRGEGWELSSEE